MNKKWIYIGIFLNEESKKELVEAANGLIPEGWKIYAHHMTCEYNTNGDADNAIFDDYKSCFGNDYIITIKTIGVSNRAIAGKVDNFTNNNKIAHITIATAPDAKPVESNYIQDWNHSIGKLLTLRGKMGYFVNGEIKYE